MRTKSDERRQHIVATAAAVFSEVGFEKASMSEIAQRVGGSKATLYSYFDSKDDLFLAVMDQAAQRLIGLVYERLNTPGPLDQVLLSFGIDYVHGLLSPELVAITRLAVAEGERSQVGRLVYEKGVARGWAELRDFLQSAFVLQGRPDLDAQSAAWHLKAMLEAEFRDARMMGVLRKPPPRAQIAAAASRAVAVWMRGYGLSEPPR